MSGHVTTNVSNTNILFECSRKLSLANFSTRPVATGLARRVKLWGGLQIVTKLYGWFVPLVFIDIIGATMEPNPGIPKEGSITLFSPDEKIKLFDDNLAFESKERWLSDLGISCLGGFRYSRYDEDELGIAIAGDQIITTNAQSLYDRGLFEIGVGLWAPHPPKAPIVCRLLLPKRNILLESYMGTPSRNESEPDLRKKYLMSTRRWSDPNSGNQEYAFFAPAYPKFLSTLRFSFKSFMEMPS